MAALAHGALAHLVRGLVVMRLLMGASSAWPLLAGAALLSLGGGFAAGYALKGVQAKAELAQVQAAHAAYREAAAQQAAQRLAAAQQAERQAVHTLDATRSRLAAANRRLKNALDTLDDRGGGLSARARGLLNDAIATQQQPAAVPEAASGAAGATASAATDSGGPAGAGPASAAGAASERAVGHWIADAIGLYAECQARLAAVREWDEVTHGR